MTEYKPGDFAIITLRASGREVHAIRTRPDVNVYTRGSWVTEEGVHVYDDNVSSVRLVRVKAKDDAPKKSEPKFGLDEVFTLFEHFSNITKERTKPAKSVWSQVADSLVDEFTKARQPEPAPPEGSAPKPYPRSDSSHANKGVIRINGKAYLRLDNGTFIDSDGKTYTWTELTSV